MNNNFSFDQYDRPQMDIFNQTFLNPNPTPTLNHPLKEPYEGFIRGNLFDHLYRQYQNYRPTKLVPNNEQAELLLNVDELSFAAHEINLYLDVYPNDTQMIALFNHYQQMANEATKAYEKKYGPLTVNALSNRDQFSWEAYAWPWEMEES